MEPIQKIFFGVVSFVSVLVLILLGGHLITDNSQWARAIAWLDFDVDTQLEFDRTNGYRLVRLIIATPNPQPEVLGLYTRMGFRPLPANPNNSKELRMVLAFS